VASNDNELTGLLVSRGHEERGGEQESEHEERLGRHVLDEADLFECALCNC
jgi:hypothetical protein